MRDALRRFLSKWGAASAAQLARGRFRMPIARAGAERVHLIVVVVNHFEPFTKGWGHAEGRGGIGHD